MTAVVDGGGGNKWDLRGGNAQKGGLTTFYSGVRPGSSTSNSYYPMRKQGAILLGTGGDNGNGSSGTFYEGVMTTGFPTEATTDAVQANIVAARYDVQRLGLSRPTTFTPNSTQDVIQTFTNSSGTPATGVKLSISAPAGWTVMASGSTNSSATFSDPVAPGAAVTATFKVTSPSKTGAVFLMGKAEWTTPAAGGKKVETATSRVRNVFPIKINEVRFNTGSSSTNQFIELYNADANTVDISNWTLINTQSQWAPVKLTTIPAGTKLASGTYYLVGLSASGLTAPVSRGATIINVRSTTGFEVGQRIDVDGETREITSVGTAAAAMTTIFIPVSTGPWITIPAGSTNLPVTNATGFAVGQKIGIDVGGNFELSTVTAVGKASTQTTLAASAVKGATNIKVAANANMTVGDTLTIGTGERGELATITSIGATGASGTGVNLTTPLRFDHVSGIDVSDVGTGISFLPATRFPHISGDTVQALGGGITLERPLTMGHAYGAPVHSALTSTEGYQGPPSPNQWFGGTLSARAGAITLLDAGGVAVVDAIVYGSQQSSSSANGTITSPEIATLEADQGKGGCIAVVPSVGRGAGPAATAAGIINKSLGRFPDGRDADNLCGDFKMQAATTVAAASVAGATNIKVASVADLAVGQTIVIDTGTNMENAVIATVGTPGATSAGTATNVGATVIPVGSTAGFSAGQTILIDNGVAQETAAVASISGGGRGGGAAINLSAPLKVAHAAGAQISGSGVTVAAALTKAHATGVQVAGSVPTPGAPNQY